MTNDHNKDGRYDIYTLIHKGLRSFMSETLATVGRVDDSDPPEVSAAIAQVRGLLEICREHLFIENQFVHPAMEARRPGSACVTARDHVQHEESFERLDAQLLAVERCSTADRKQALLTLYRMLALFVADNYQHMNVEECANSQVLWAVYTDEELGKIHKSILAAVRPDRMPQHIRWMLPNIPHADRVNMLFGVRQAMPKPAFENVLRLVRSHVNQQDWSKLAAALSLSATPA